jgi:hypothetical protein
MTGSAGLALRDDCDHVQRGDHRCRRVCLLPLRDLLAQPAQHLILRVLTEHTHPRRARMAVVRDDARARQQCALAELGHLRIPAVSFCPCRVTPGQLTGGRRIRTQRGRALGDLLLVRGEAGRRLGRGGAERGGCGGHCRGRRVRRVLVSGRGLRRAVTHRVLGLGPPLLEGAVADGQRDQDCQRGQYNGHPAPRAEGAACFLASVRELHGASAAGLLFSRSELLPPRSRYVQVRCRDTGFRRGA